jgi:catechol 2,3-dioxygenase
MHPGWKAAARPQNGRSALAEERRIGIMREGRVVPISARTSRGSARRRTVPLSVAKVGHIVLRVSDLDRALEFYSGVLGLHEVARRDFGEGPMVFLSSGSSHHDIALVEAGTVAHGDNLHHFALKVGDSLDELAEVRHILAANHVPVHMALDHHVSQGLYVSDHDGNLIELYVDADQRLWRDDPTAVANSDPLTLS